MENLQSFGVQDLSTSDVKIISGGGWLSGLVSDGIRDAADTAMSFFSGIMSYVNNLPISHYPQCPRGCLSN